MGSKPSSLRRVLRALPHKRPPLTGVEVRDSNWAEWNEVVSGFAAIEAADSLPTALEPREPHAPEEEPPRG